MVKHRKTFIAYINELGNMGFINHEEHTKIKERINNRYDGFGWR